MTLKEHIDNVRDRLKNKEYPNEQAVRLGIIDPLLRILGWPTDKPQIVFPEYPVGSGNVDYALCHPSSTPRVFIEAKQVGNIKGAEEQLFGYDARIRVPIAVLTDGNVEFELVIAFVGLRFPQIPGRPRAAVHDGEQGGAEVVRRRLVPVALPVAGGRAGGEGEQEGEEEAVGSHAP